MKVVHIGFKYGLNNTGGAAIAATRLHLALLKAGVESHYICVWKYEDGPNVYELPTGILRKVFLNATKILRWIWKFSSLRQVVFVNVVPLFGLDKLLRQISPDVIHVQWINADVMSFRQLSHLRYPVVMHLHDMWPIAGINPCPLDDDRFVSGFTTENTSLLEAFLFNSKRRAVERLKPTFIAPSDWMCGQCKKSLIGHHAPVSRIDNIYDERFFKDILPQRNCHNVFRVAFGCYMGTKNLIKGWDDFIEALRNLPEDVKYRTQVDVFGEDSQSTEIGGVHIVFHGTLADAESVADLYHEVNLAIVPSKSDNAPAAKFEALLCGFPVVAFNRTGCAECLSQGETGWIASDGDYQGFADGIEYFFHKEIDGGGIRHEEIARAARSMLDTNRTIRLTLDAYDSVIKKCLLHR